MIKRFTPMLIVSILLINGLTPISAQSINITGTVVDSVTSQGVSGALVRIAELPLITAITSSTGAFVLSGNSVRSSRMALGGLHSAEITLHGSGMTITAPQGTNAVIEVFTGNGARIRRVNASAGSDGVMRIGNLWQAAQVYFVKVRINGVTQVFSTLGISHGPRSSAVSGSSSLTKIAANYTLLISADTYISRQYVMTSASGSTGTLKMSPWPIAGNPKVSTCVIPAEAALANVSSPKTVVGTGTPASCTPAAFIAAVARGGVITFNSGNLPVTITLTQPAKVFNDSSSDIVIDGKGLVTLSGGGTTRILYMNTCDQAQHWTSPRCDNQATPRLTVQNLTFINGNSRNETDRSGGAILAIGGQFKALNCRFFNNVCDSTGPDVGGAAIRVMKQYQGLPAYVVNCTFGGASGLGNSGSNGGGLSSIGVSWTVINSVFTFNRCTGRGGNPATSGTPGGGSGGGIYNDGNTMTLRICGSLFEDNRVNAYGGAIFFVSNDHTGNIVIDQTVSQYNTGGAWYPVYQGISMHSDTPIQVTNSTIQ